MKTLLYEQVARIGKALASPKRLELLALLSQSEKTVEALADAAGIDIKLTSAHLRALREAQLISVRREGRFMYYSLSADDVAEMLIKVRDVAGAHLAELRLALHELSTLPDVLRTETRKSLLAKARAGDIVIIDVRPADEYAAAHLPCARSMPLAELKRHIQTLSPAVPVVAYCRGPYCVMADTAVKLLRKKGFSAHKMAEGVTEWRATGLSLEHENRRLP